jgi:PPOX class probable FMN-dependent enzyme
MDNIFGISVDQELKNSGDLRAIVAEPSLWVSNKVIDHVDALSARFIAASPLIIVSSTREDGALDMTPRGDPPGFVKVINPGLIAIPDRPGNKRMDTHENIFRNPNVGLIFIIPGHRDTLRLSGKAALVQDANLGATLAVNGKPAELVMLVQVERVLCHCPKAFIRGQVWQSEDWPDATDVPTLAEMMKAHGEMAETLDVVEDGVRTDRETKLY